MQIMYYSCLLIYYIHISSSFAPHGRIELPSSRRQRVIISRYTNGAKFQSHLENIHLVDLHIFHFIYRCDSGFNNFYHLDIFFFYYVYHYLYFWIYMLVFVNGSLDKEALYYPNYYLYYYHLYVLILM